MEPNPQLLLRIIVSLSIVKHLVLCVPLGEEGAHSLFDSANVVVLTEETFDKTVKEYQYVMVNFFAPWCTYCKELAPKYAAAADALSAMGVSVVLAELDTMAYRKKAQELEIHRLPTLRWYVDAQPHNYTGRRDTNSILKWVLQRVPIIGEVENLEDLALLRAKSEVFFLAYIWEYQGEAMGLHKYASA
eukprot:jgi/Botrbrau1/3292/Bobra.174_1s0055.1